MTTEINTNATGEQLVTTSRKHVIDNTYVRVCGRWIKKSLLTRVWNQVRNRFGLFQPDIAYTANEVCGDLFWNRLNRDDKKLADLCVCDLIEQGDLSMGKIANSAEGIHQYCLISI